MLRILGREGEDTRTERSFNIYIVQAVLGCDPNHRLDTGCFLPHSDAVDIGRTTQDVGGWDLVVPPS